MDNTMLVYAERFNNKAEAIKRFEDVKENPKYETLYIEFKTIEQGKEYAIEYYQVK